MGTDQQQAQQQHLNGNRHFGGSGVNNGGISGGNVMSNDKTNTSDRLVQSTPGSPQEHNRPHSFEVIGSAESLVGRVSINLIKQANLRTHK